MMKVSNFTEQELKESKEFKLWILNDVVVFIHDTYYDHKAPYSAYIVITKTDNTYEITRFFKTNEKIQVSVDHKKLTAEMVFEILLEKYSRGLK